MSTPHAEKDAASGSDEDDISIDITNARRHARGLDQALTKIQEKHERKMKGKPTAGETQTKQK